MDSDGRHTAQGGTEIPEDNVVRLPREWLGPAEKLVPFGDDEPDDGLGTPPSTYDFWGEALGDDFGVRADAPAATPADHVRSHRRVRRPRPRRVGVPSPSRLGLPSRPRRRPGDAPRRVPASALLGVAALLTLVALALGNGGGATTRGRAQTAANVRARGAATPFRNPLASAGALSSRPSHALRRTSGHPVSGRARRARGTPHATRRRTPTRRAIRAAHRPPPHALTVEPVRYAAPVTTPSPSSSTPPVTTPAPVTAPAPAPAATRASAESHQPATGSSGSLGPGSSPDR